MEATNLALSPRETLKPRADNKGLQLTSKPNQVSTVLLYGVPIVSLVIEGNERLCLAQISNTLLKQFSYNEIHNRRVALGITCVQCTPVQLEILRRAGAMPVSSRRCGMITRREAERLCKSFLGDNAPPRLPDDFAFAVHHECAWGCRGAFLPARYNSSRAKCIKCAFCGLFFSPNKFIFHSHRVGPGDKYVQPDAANFNSWRRHMKLSGTPPDEVVHAWEDVKAMFNGGTRKRMLSAARRVPFRRPEPEPEAKRPAPSPPTAHAPVPRLADYVWGARLPLPYAIPWLKPTLWTPGALTALSGVGSMEEPRAFRPVRRMDSPISPGSHTRSPNSRSPLSASSRRSRSPLQSPLRSPARTPARSPHRSPQRSPLRSPPHSPKSDRDSDESVDIETTEEDQPRDVILTTLNFYARGSYQGSVAQNNDAPMAQQTVSTCIREVTNALNKPHIVAKYIRFPQNRQERTTIKSRFYNKYGIPGVCGCIDCTHIALTRPTHNEERFYNRKSFHSLNVQMPCAWPCRSAPTPRPEECWSALVPKVERDEDRMEPWRLPDLRPSLHYTMHERDRESCVACVAPLPLIQPPAPAPH